MKYKLRWVVFWCIFRKIVGSICQYSMLAMWATFGSVTVIFVQWCIKYVYSAPYRMVGASDFVMEYVFACHMPNAGGIFVSGTYLAITHEV